MLESYSVSLPKKSRQGDSLTSIYLCNLTKNLTAQSAHLNYAVLPKEPSRLRRLCDKGNMKYCQKCGKVVGKGKSLCPYCGGKRFWDSQSEEYKNRPVTPKQQLPAPKKKRNKIAIAALIASIIIAVLGVLFVVLDATRVIPTGVFAPDRVSERYIDDDGDARSPESDDRVISETIDPEEPGEG